MKNYEYIVVTDIGSTTTKGLLLGRDADSWRVLGIENSPTTVEKPLEDVRIGLYNAIRLLEEKTQVVLLAPDSEQERFILQENVCYLTTSSAGGGLQILVIGLTLNESASSAQRAAYGAGGVILDTLAINDNRTAIEQVGLIDLLRPDIILFSGGVDGGAYASVIRLSEILKVSNPKPKFGVESKIPLIYAGNIEARDFLRTVFGDKFDLHFVDNIRPNMKEENLGPARDEIHRIFMENVMEQAPGYAMLKELVSADIIPTPAGVLKSLETFGKDREKNIIAFDIGGATTDIFSNIFGKYYRTVSANYGMSYSIANVMADAGFENIKRRLPAVLDDDYVRNYICNKMLYPTYLPESDIQKEIEKGVAKEAIRMSCRHHLEMNFRIQNIGYLDKIKDEHCQFYDAMYYEKGLEEKRFFLKDFDVILAAGGIVTATADIKETALIVNDAMDIDGITEIWCDTHFLSPHLGKLSEVSPEIASAILFREGYQKVAVSVKPLAKPCKKKVRLLKVSITDGSSSNHYDVYNDELHYLEVSSEAQVKIECTSQAKLAAKGKIVEFTTDVPVLIDTRKNNRYQTPDELRGYRGNSPQDNGHSLEESFAKFSGSKQILHGKAQIVRSLPYTGEIYVKAGESVEPDTLLGEVKFEPPRLFIINLFTSLGISAQEFAEGLTVKEGETINSGARILDLPVQGLLSYHRFYDSPVTGFVERINSNTGSIYLREIQDYPLKPLKIKIASLIGVKPGNLTGYLKRRKGDFVRTGEALAKNLNAMNEGAELKRVPIFSSPTTGTITDIDTTAGTITIQYLKKATPMHSGIPAKITGIKDNKMVFLEYEGTTISGIIGFGKENYGKLAFVRSRENPDFTSLQGKIVVYPHQADLNMLKQWASAKIKGLVIPSINNADLTKFIGKEIGVALTGSEMIDYPIILTEGFGRFAMHSGIAEILEKAEGKGCFLQTFTQIRAGVTRPKIIITD